ncbi:hypothetical protein BJX76DRAFT_358982 [Aspergillus varians]
MTPRTFDYFAFKHPTNFTSTAPLSSPQQHAIKITTTKVDFKMGTYIDCYPSCHICTSLIYLKGSNHRLTPGIHTSEDLLTDSRFWRHDNQLCQISGIAYLLKKWPYSQHLRVPWDEETGVVEPDNVDDQRLLARAFVSGQWDRDIPHNRLTGFTVHPSCWELLRTHRAWVLAGGDVGVILRALRRKIGMDPPGPKRDIWDINWPMMSDYSGPFFNPRVQQFIRQARRMTQKRFKVIRHKDRGKTLLCRLPPEILVMVANFLPAPGAAAVQKVVGTYLGDMFWRSRISTDFFHEVRAIKNETLDWEYLASELERFDGDHRVELMKESKFLNSKRKRFNGDLYEELLSRRWLLRRLDQMADLIPSGISD